MKNLQFFILGIISLSLSCNYSLSQIHQTDTSHYQIIRDIRFEGNPSVISVNKSVYENLATVLQQQPQFFKNNKVDCDCMKELSGPEFEEIKYNIEYTVGHLYFNDYFNNHPNLSYFQRYFQNVPNLHNPANLQEAGLAAPGTKPA